MQEMSTLAQTLHKALPDLTPKEVADLADDLGAQAVAQTQEQRMREGWDNLGPTECAARMRTAQHLALEALITQTVEAPQQAD